MLLEKLHKKRDFLLSWSADEQFVRLASGIEKVTQPNPHLMPGLKLPVAEALLYAIFRHRNFCGTSILVDTLVAYLGQNFGLPRSHSEEIIEQVLHSSACLALRKSTFVPSTNREFLKYLFVQVACTEDDSELIEDLGLGSDILCRMKKSIEIVSAIQDAEADAPLLFLPDLDAQVCEIMSDMTRDIQSTSWALQRRRLLYHLMLAADIWQEALRSRGPGPLFETLVAIGERRLVTTAHICEDLSKKYPEVAQCPKNSDILEDFSLAYPSGEKTKASTRWSLTGFGMELTQEPIAESFLKKNQSSWDISAFSSLSAEYQTAVIRKSDLQDPDLFMQLIRNARPLAPKALTRMLDSLVAMNQAPMAHDVAIFVLRNEPSPWLRKAACRSLATTLRTETVDQVFHEVARSDKSASVRAEAQACIG
jgi:hypothetical protein